MAPPNPGIDAGLLSPVWAGDDVVAMLSDEAWVTVLLEAEVALARAQAALGVIPAVAVAPIAEAAGSMTVDVAALAVRSRAAANPVVALVPELVAAVAALDPAAAEYVHRGGTSQDILDSAVNVLSSRVLRRIESDLADVAGALAELVETHRDTPMAGRTLTQHAVPITFGLKAAGWLSLVLDAADRVRRTAAGLPAQLGGAAGTMAAYREYAVLAGVPGPGHGIELAARFARELGLRDQDVPWHSRRSSMADLGATLSFVTGALGKFALDVQSLCRTEVSELAEPAGEGRGASSAMPQKRNPVLATLIVTAARQVPLYALVLAQSMVCEDERSAGAWHAEWQPLREALRVTAGASRTAAELAGGIEVFPDAMRGNLLLTGGAVMSERLNVVLSPVLGNATAKRLLARLAHEAASSGVPLAALLAKAPELQGLLPDETALRDLLDPEGYLGDSRELADRVLVRYRGPTG
jgi:3-carboxy-cis,cis-muconate cycloisomerase